MIYGSDARGERPALCCGAGRVLKSGQSINSHSKWRRGKFTFNCIQAHATVQLKGKVKGGDCKKKKKTTKTRSVCGPSNPVVWYTAPLKLTVVFIVALEISLVKLQAWPVNQGCLSLPAAQIRPPKKKKLHVCAAHMKTSLVQTRLVTVCVGGCDWAGLAEHGEGRVVWGYSCLCKSVCLWGFTQYEHLYVCIV